MKNHKWFSIVLILTIALGVLGISSSQAGIDNGSPVRLQAGTFNPSQGESLSLPPGLTIAGYAQGQRGYYIVQFTGPVQSAWQSQVRMMGAEFLGYIPENAFKVRMNPAQAARVASMDSVAWVGIFQPAYKLSPDLDLDGANLMRVRIEHIANAGLVRAAIARSGAQVLGGSGDYLFVAATGDQLQAIANVLDIAWIEKYVLAEKHNEYGAGQILGANIANASGYDGSTQIAAVADTGLGDGATTGAHPDIPASRITAIYNWPGVTNICFQTIINDGAQDVDSGHGTHTAASVLSDGGPGGEGKGVAPAAGLVFQATENFARISNYCQILGGWPASGYFLTGLPDNLGDMYQQAYNAGARIHSNSWGSAQAGVYTADSANTDAFIWNNPDMTITFSAGNEGADANANGVIDNDSIGSPATAKNVITVGASENDRQGNYQCDNTLTYSSHDAYQPGQTCSSMGGVNLLGTYGQRWGFPADPIASDLTAGNAEQMAAFSSRGPTDDGRIKPDVVAPGTWVLSGFSGMYQEGYGDPVNPQNGVYQWDGWGMPMNEEYKYMGGTSMSNPIAAGAATVVRDFYQKVYGLNASAALVKATMINTAIDLLDENNDGVNDNDYPIPNVHEGWGRVNLATATDGSQQYAENTAGLNTGGSVNYQYSVNAGAAFKVTLVWSDYPSTEAASQNLVNNLNLIVTSPGGAVYRGNVFSGGWSQTGGSADTVNNVENVFVQSAEAGTWSVQVSGANIPNGPQPFALVVDGQFGEADPPPTVTITNPLEATTIFNTITVSADAGDDNGVAQVEFFVDGTSIGIDTSAPYSVAWDTTLVSDGGHVVSATATDSIGQTASDSVNITVDNINDPPIATFTYSCSGLSCDFDASRSFDPDGTISDYAWDLGDGNNGSGVTTSHTYGASGSYDVVLTVTDNGGETGTDTQTVSVSDAVPLTVHSGDLDGTSLEALRGRWDANVTILVHDNNENPVANATVDGSWSGGATGGATCTTNTSGQCTVTKGNLKNNISSVTFTISNITSITGAYASGDNHDPDGDSDGTTITVLQPGANSTPVVSITSPADGATFASGATIDFAGTASDNEDGNISVNLVWKSNIDGQFGSGAGFSAVISDGAHTITASVTDSAGTTTNESISITVGDPPQLKFVHVGDLDGSSATATRNRWNATVTITVHDENHNLIAGAIVSGFWGEGTGPMICTTGANGQCSVSLNDIKSNVSSVTFTINGISYSTYIYNAAGNHDPDGDSDGISIIVPKP